ncbi:MAG: hypothetical protein GYA55_12155 [SAR324 cluster bacterium]|uniref:Uncharacterized protein n=1 Tax=SAR324 cluster bacterium TaxID=2024889 RepID=A0A7X9FTJ7_9DELT|nr:hypothetical protein [SAR324 cluster bacterium]
MQVRKYLVFLSALYALPFVQTVSAQETTPEPTPTIEIKEDFSACNFDKDKIMDTVVKKGKKLTVTFSKSKKKINIPLDKAYVYFKCKVVKKQTVLLARRSLKHRWSTIIVPSSEGLGKVCPKIISLGYHQLYKYSASGHLAGSDRARACSFIGGSGASVPSASSLPIYDKSGQVLSTFKAYAKYGRIYRFRFYTYSPPCSEIAYTAKRRTGSAEGYIGLGGGTCIKIGNLYGREGGVK